MQLQHIEIQYSIMHLSYAVHEGKQVSGDPPIAAFSSAMFFTPE